MRVLFFNRNHSSWPGGDAVHLEHTMLELRKLGVECDYRYTLPTVEELKTYDLVHVFHINFNWSRLIIQECLIEQIPYVITPLFYPEKFDVEFPEMKGYLDAAKKVFVLSPTEEQEMIKLTGCNGENIAIIPNGVDKDLFNYEGRDATSFSRAITLARVIPSKGILEAALACQRLEIPFAYAGQVHDQAYHEQILATGAQYLGVLQPEDVARALKTSHLYICTSESERMSLGVLEAAACGLPIVDSIHNRGAYLLPHSERVDPKNNDDLDAAILHKWYVQQNLDTVLSWSDVAREVKAFYDEL